jgi:hypothetical protein
VLMTRDRHALPTAGFRLALAKRASGEGPPGASGPRPERKSSAATRHARATTRSRHSGLGRCRLRLARRRTAPRCRPSGRAEVGPSQVVATLRLATLRLATLRFAPLRSASVRVASRRSARIRVALLRLAPSMSASQVGPGQDGLGQVGPVRLAPLGGAETPSRVHGWGHGLASSATHGARRRAIPSGQVPCQGELRSSARDTREARCRSRVGKTRYLQASPRSSSRQEDGMSTGTVAVSALAWRWVCSAWPRVHA